MRFSKVLLIGVCSSIILLFLGYAYVQRVFRDQREGLESLYKKVQSQQASLEKMDAERQKIDEWIADQKSHLHDLEVQIQSLALSHEIQSPSEVAQKIISLLAESEHDIDVLVREQIQQEWSNLSSRLEWLDHLKRIQPDKKMQLQRVIAKRPTWAELKKILATYQKNKNEEASLYHLSKFGITVSSSQEQDGLTSFAHLLDKQDGHQLCTFYQNSSLPQALQDSLFFACSTDAFFAIYDEHHS